MNSILIPKADMHAIKLTNPANGGGTALQQELSDVTAEMNKCVSRLHELSARKAKLELRVLVGQ